MMRRLAAVARAPRWLAAVALLLQACAALEPSGPAVAAPDLRVGDSWTFQEYDGFNGLPKGQVRLRVRELTPDAVAMEVERDSRRETVRYTREWNPHSGSLPEGRGVDFAPPYPAFVFPLQVGQSWTLTTQATDRSTGKKIQAKVYARVTGKERVKSPAGEFDTLRVVRQVFLDDRDWWRSGTAIVEVDWYAADARAVVRHEDRSEYRDLSRGSDSFPFSGNIILGDRSRLLLLSYTLGGVPR